MRLGLVKLNVFRHAKSPQEENTRVHVCVKQRYGLPKRLGIHINLDKYLFNKWW